MGKRGNENAVKWGLTSKSPLHQVAVSAQANTDDLAAFASDLAAASLWIAQELDGEQAAPRMVGLYASVAAELEQLAAELAGKTGIKPAPLGELSDEAYERLRTQQAKALSLLLSQIMTAWKRLEAQVDVMGGDNADGSRRRALVDVDGDPVAVLNYLAGFLRSAKRMMRDFAANLAWRERGMERIEDLAAQILEQLKERKDANVHVVSARSQSGEDG